MNPEDWRNAPSMVTLIKAAYDRSCPHQQAQIRAWMATQGQTLGDTERMTWVLKNCKIYTVGTDKVLGGSDIKNRRQIDNQLKKTK